MVKKALCKLLGIVMTQEIEESFELFCRTLQPSGRRAARRCEAVALPRSDSDMLTKSVYVVVSAVICAHGSLSIQASALVSRESPFQSSAGLPICSSRCMVVTSSAEQISQTR